MGAANQTPPAHNKRKTWAESEPAVDCESDFMSAVSSGASNANSDLSKSSDNYPVRSDNCTELAAQIDELKKIHNKVKTDIEDFSSPRVLFTHLNGLKPTYIAD